MKTPPTHENSNQEMEVQATENQTVHQPPPHREKSQDDPEAKKQRIDIADPFVVSSESDDFAVADSQENTVDGYGSDVSSESDTADQVWIGGLVETFCHECHRNYLMKELEVCEQCKEDGYEANTCCRFCAFTYHVEFRHRNVVPAEMHNAKLTLKKTVKDARVDLERCIEQMKIDCQKMVPQNEKALEEISALAKVCLDSNVSIPMLQQANFKIKRMHDGMMAKNKRVQEAMDSLAY